MFLFFILIVSSCSDKDVLLWVDSLIIVIQKPRVLHGCCKLSRGFHFRIAYKMVLKGKGGWRGRNTRGEEWSYGATREAKGKRKMPAGKQMVAPFIGLFVGSAMTFRPAMKQAGDSPCVREYQATRLQLLFLLKCIYKLLTRVVSIIVSINYSKCNLKLVIIFSIISSHVRYFIVFSFLFIYFYNVYQ